MTGPPFPLESETAADERATVAARRVVLLLVAALAAAAGAAIVLVFGGGGGDDPGPAADDVPVAAIGPEDGVDLASYAAARAEVLRALDGRAVAVVSFEDYLPAAEVDGRLVDGVEPVALLVALPGSPPATTTDPSAWRSDTVADARTQAAEISGLLPTVDDEEFVAFYRAELARYEQVIAAADRADVVFAVVVRASGPQLRALASRPGIRLVDAVGGTGLAGAAEVGGLRPEETSRAGTPEFRPA